MVVTKKMRRSSRKRNIDSFRVTRMSRTENKYAGVKQANSMRRRAKRVAEMLGLGNLVKGNK